MLTKGDLAHTVNQHSQSKMDTEMWTTEKKTHLRGLRMVDKKAS